MYIPKGIYIIQQLYRRYNCSLYNSIVDTIIVVYIPKGIYTTIVYLQVYNSMSYAHTTISTQQILQSVRLEQSSNLSTERSSEPKRKASVCLQAYKDYVVDIILVTIWVFRPKLLSCRHITPMVSCRAQGSRPWSLGP